MTTPFQFADSLGRFVDRSAYTPGQLANLSGVPKTTIVNWLNGRVQKPRDWQPLLQLLAVLHLESREADEVLNAAGHPTLTELVRLADDADQALLQPWQTETAPPPRHAPFQAIADVPHFVGREKILEQIQTHLRQPDAGAVCTVQGMAGSGKTTLAAHLAYELRPHFPDGVLWARLDASSPMAILGTFAHAYGVDVTPYTDPDSRGRVVRDLLADKRALIILDNAPDSGSVTPLLPPTGRCAVLITTRQRGLRVAQRGLRLTLPPFSADGRAVHALFRRILGPDRADAEADALRQIADAVGHLPLALAIIAGRLAHEPGWTAVAFLNRLHTRRLQELQFDDQNVARSFQITVERLSAADQRLFAGLALLGGEDFPPAEAAAVAALDLFDAEDGLRRLHSLSLLQTGRPGRYRLHPLLQDFARTLPRDEAEVITRLLDYIADLLTTEPHGFDLFDPEQSSILAALDLAWKQGRTEELTHLTLLFLPYLKMRGLYDIAEKLLRRVLRAPLPAEAQMETLLHLAQLARLRRDYDTAVATLQTAWPLAEERDGWRSALLTEEGIVAACRGDYGRARAQFAAARPLARRHAPPAWQISLLKESGAAAVDEGEYDEAEAYYREALALARAEAPHHAPTLLRCLGSILIARDRDYAAAQAPYEEALRGARAVGHREGVVFLLNNLGVVAYANGRGPEAAHYLQESLALAQQVGHLPALSMILSNLGRLALDEGDVSGAVGYFEEALATAVRARHHELVMAVHRSLAAATAVQEEWAAAEAHLNKALARARQIQHAPSWRRLLWYWAWLDTQAPGPTRFPEVYAEAASEVGLPWTMAELRTAVGEIPLESLTIFYD